MGSEVELKLEIAGEAADELERAGLLGPSLGHALLHATYYDTPDRRLRRRGLTLRIRREGKRLVQTVKTAHPAAGLFDRGEWELTVPQWRPVIDERTPLGRALADAPAPLEAQFELVVHRDSFTIEADDSTIAAALDRGTARAMDRSAGFCELELELTAGSPAALFALARRIEAAVPVRIGVLSKAERGFRLLGELRRSEKAGAVRLEPRQSPVAACAAVLGGCLRQYRLNESVLLARREGEAVHQARVALRRLRSARTIFADLLRDDETDRIDAALRELARAYGAARDLDVLIRRSPTPAARATLAAPRDAAYRDLAVTLNAPATRRLALDLAEWIALGAWREDPETLAMREVSLAEFAARALDRRLRRVRKHGRHLAELDDEARHELRKDTKKLRYAVDFFAALWPRGVPAKRRRKFLAALEDLQHLLGELNDLAVEAVTLGAAAPDRSEDCDKLLRKASEARHALLACEPFWS